MHFLLFAYRFTALWIWAPCRAYVNNNSAECTALQGVECCSTSKLRQVQYSSDAVNILLRNLKFRYGQSRCELWQEKMQCQFPESLMMGYSRERSSACKMEQNTKGIEITPCNILATAYHIAFYRVQILKYWGTSLLTGGCPSTSVNWQVLKLSYCVVTILSTTVFKDIPGI